MAIRAWPKSQNTENVVKVDNVITSGKRTVKQKAELAEYGKSIVQKSI